MTTHTIDTDAIEPMPGSVALQKALEALEAAEAELHPRDAQPTHAIRNRIQFAAFLVRGQIKQMQSAAEANAMPTVAPGQCPMCGEFSMSARARQGLYGHKVEL